MWLPTGTGTGLTCSMLFLKTESKKMKRTFAIILIFIPICIVLRAQDEMDIEDLLNEEVINENPVYKPVIGLGSGVFNFYGDVRNNYINPIIGDFGYKVNISTFVDPKRFFTLNMFILYGQLSGNERSLTDLSRNLNFKTDLVDFGINLEYSFRHFLKKEYFITPFISAGIENMQFTSKADLLDAMGNEYYYYSDGTIRDADPTEIFQGDVIHRDFLYETDLRVKERREYGLGAYKTNAISIPVDLGLNFRISENINCRLGTSLHFTMTDYLDNVANEGTHIKGNKGNDMFTYNYLSLHFDLFSEPKTIIVEKMFAELEFDPVMYDDEDGDFILDAVDECPGTPYNVPVNNTGCPLDTDNDGIPDYLDEEEFTEEGAWVDDRGITISEEEYAARWLKRGEAMNREDVKAYFAIIGSGFEPKPFEEIPAKFRSLDTDMNGYLSFDELLKSVDDYFDYKLNFTVEDLYELNNFFFNQ